MIRIIRVDVASSARQAFLVSTLPKQIADKFLAKLEESKSLDAEKIDQLRALLNGGKKLKSEDFVKIFSAPAGYKGVCRDQNIL